MHPSGDTLMIARTRCATDRVMPARRCEIESGAKDAQQRLRCCLICMVRSVVILWSLSLIGCSQSSESIYTVRKTSVNLGNIMYTDADDGMYDVWYDGIELTNGKSTIRVALDGSEPNYDQLSSLSVGDRVEIKTDLSLLDPDLLDAYWARASTL